MEGYTTRNMSVRTHDRKHITLTPLQDPADWRGRGVGGWAVKLSLSCLLLFESNPADTCFVTV